MRLFNNKQYANIVIYAENLTSLITFEYIDRRIFIHVYDHTVTDTSFLPVGYIERAYYTVKI